MKSIFEATACNEVLNRINGLSPDTVPQWGKMNVSQMLSHCQEPLKLALGKSSLKRPNIFMRTLFKSFKNTLYNDKPWRKNLATVKAFRVTDEKDFKTEQSKLLDLVEAFHMRKDDKVWPAHPVFGKFTAEQWGKMQYKHLDHHLRQFNIV